LTTAAKYGTLVEKEQVMSHPDPLYDYHDDFYGESMDYEDYNDDNDIDDSWYDDIDDSMDGDHDSAMDSVGWGDDDSLAYGGGVDYYGYDDGE